MKKLKFEDAILLAFFLALIIAVSAAITYDMLFPSSGKIIIEEEGNVELLACWDELLTSPATQLLWGDVYALGTVTKSMWIKNIGNRRASLSLYTSDWNPMDYEQYFSVSWDAEGTVVEPAQKIKVVLSLYVNYTVPEAEISFSYNTHILASEVP